MHQTKTPAIFLIKEGGDDHREKRIVEELNILGIKSQALDIFRLCVSSEGFFYSGKKLVFGVQDVFWSISNSAITKKVSSSALFKNSFIWPSAQTHFFSDKFLGNCFFAQNNISTPKTVLINKSDLNDLAMSIGGFPCVIKRTNGSRGTEVAIANSEKDILCFIEKIYAKKLSAFGRWKDDFCFILQEYIKESSGVDFRVLCIEDEIIGCIKRSSQSEDFRANVSLGGQASKFDIPEDLSLICRQIMQRGNLFYAGLDFIKSDRGWLAIEVNTCAQFEGFEKATGINVAKKIAEKLVQKMQKA